GRGGRAQGGRPTLAPAALLGLCVCALLVVGTRYVSDQLSVKRMAQAINERIAGLDAGTGARLLSYDTYLHGIPFYTGRPVDVVNWTGEMHYAKRFARFAHRFGDDATIRALPEPGFRTFVVLKRRELDNFLALNPAEEIRALSPHGPWVLAEF
ncbi:MAG: hypothetical protein ABII00_02780, partial [Elusimicrobiota bacterium]